MFNGPQPHLDSTSMSPPGRSLAGCPWGIWALRLLNELQHHRPRERSWTMWRSHGREVKVWGTAWGWGGWAKQAKLTLETSIPKLGPTDHLFCKFVINIPWKRVQWFNIFEKCCILAHSPHLGDLQFTWAFKGYEKSCRVFWFYLLEVQTCLVSEPSLHKYQFISHIKSFVDHGMDGRCRPDHGQGFWSLPRWP